MEKVYLGDSVYAQIEHGMIKLTTEDGVSVSNTIYLELEVFDALCAYVVAWLRQGSSKVKKEHKQE
jgi:hypothetical protein